MSKQEKLPVCKLCGHEPGFRSPPVTVECFTAGCPIRAVRMTVEDWRRLMARTRLAPEHVKALVAMNNRLFGAKSVPAVGGQTVGHEIMRVIMTGQERCAWMDAIRAALGRSEK